jgi:dimethylhistidine N-methyltransferase
MFDYQEFKKDIEEGLLSSSKSIPSKYFYDNRGSELFRKIMHLPEYYLTDCEAKIFRDQKSEIALEILKTGKPLDLVELGAGDGSKTQLLIREMLALNSELRYIPIDISEESNNVLYRRFKSLFPNLYISPLNTDYLTGLKQLKDNNKNSKFIFFLGANVGNFSFDEAVQFYTSIAGTLNTGDRILTGFDLKKNPETILAAYNDNSGVTREFNLNLLRRINRELNANFDLNNFIHYPVYEPESGAAKSFLVSKVKQVVHIGSLGRDFEFDKWELIHTEISQKYDTAMIEDLCEKVGFRVIHNFTDPEEFFVDSLWEYNP